MNELSMGIINIRGKSVSITPISRGNSWAFSFWRKSEARRWNDCSSSNTVTFASALSLSSLSSQIGTYHYYPYSGSYTAYNNPLHSFFISSPCDTVHIAYMHSSPVF